LKIQLQSSLLWSTAAMGTFINIFGKPVYYLRDKPNN